MNPQFRTPQQPGPGVVVVVVVRFEIALHWASKGKMTNRLSTPRPMQSVAYQTWWSRATRAGFTSSTSAALPLCQRGHGDRGDISQCTHVLPACRLPRGSLDEDYAVRATPVVHSAHALLTFWSCTLASVSASLFTFALVEKLKKRKN